MEKRVPDSKIRIRCQPRDWFPKVLKIGNKTLGNINDDVLEHVLEKGLPFVVRYIPGSGKPSGEEVENFEDKETISGQGLASIIERNTVQEEGDSFKTYWKNTKYMFYTMLCLVANSKDAQVEMYKKVMSSPNAQEELIKFLKGVKEFWQTKFNPLTSDRKEGYSQVLKKYKKKLKAVDEEMEQMRKRMKEMLKRKNEILEQRDEELSQYDPNYVRKNYGGNSIWGVKTGTKSVVTTGRNDNEDWSSGSDEEKDAAAFSF